MAPNTNTAAALYARAFAAYQQARPRDALAILEQLLRQWPRHLDARNLAGVICMVGRDFDGAIRHFEQAVALGAGAGILTNLGFAYQALEQHERAASTYARAVELDPGLGLVWQKLGGLRALKGQPEDALECYRRAVELDPHDLKSLGDALDLRRHLADWDPAREPTPEALLSAFDTAPRSDFSPGLLLFLPEADAAAQRRAALKFARSQWQGQLSAPPMVAKAQPAEGRRLRVGYLSTDFRNHAVSFLAVEVIAAHDRERFEVFMYAYGPPADDDPWRDAAILAADHFIDVDGLDDAAAARRIASDRIDILVDFNGYTLHARSGILAYRPAPVIAGWIGYIGTMGEPRLTDYVLGDAIATPPELAPHFSEALALMPHCFQPNGVLAPPLTTPSRAGEGLPEDALVFCSFNQTHKMHPRLWDDWCAILRAVPDSVLWLAPPRHEQGQRNLRAEAADRGVAPERIVFAEKKSRQAHLDRIALADLALDTYPYNSGTTASDALRMGVPLLCFLGETFAGRMAGSLLHHLGLPECVAADRAGYVALAIGLARDRGRRDALRRQLQERLSESDLFRPDRFARDLERMFSAMHAQSLAGLRGTIDLTSR